MTQAHWLRLARRATLPARIQRDPVLPLYPHLLAQFAAWTPLTWPDAIVGLHTAYAWMPTIPNLALPAALTAADQAGIVALLNDARQRLLTAAELAVLKSRFCNNSMVGSSKLLHFLAPDRYPIWDRRVATAWYRPRRAYPYHYDRPDEYLAYVAAVHAWSSAPATAAARSRLRTLSPHLATVSDVRLIELVLFHA